MHEQFGEVDEMGGRLSIDGEVIGECVAKVYYNPYELNNMEAELFNPPDFRQDQLSDHSFANLETVDSKLVDKSPDTLRELHFRTTELATPSFSFSSSVSVTKYRSNQFFKERGECTSATVYYRFPLTSVVKPRLRPTKDSRHGLYRGELDQETGTVDLDSNAFEIETPLGAAEVVGLYESHDLGKRTNYPVTAVVSQSAVGFQGLDCASGSYENLLDQVRDTVERIMLLFSLVEQDRINWAREKVKFTSDDGKGVGRQTTRRWSSPPTDGYHAGYRANTKTREAFQTINAAYWSLVSEEREKVDRALSNFTTAYTRTTIETGLVYWHSCLDHICEALYGQNHRVFSGKIVETCDAAGIEVGDLLEEEVLAYWRKDLDGETENFRFVETRNAFVHDHLGTTLGEGHKVIEDGRTARALAERLLLAKMGVDPDTVPLGEAGFP